MKSMKNSKKKSTFSKLLKWTSVALFLGVLSISSCKKEDKTEDDKKPTSGKNYIAAGSYGDLITYEIDRANKTITFNNETTNQKSTVPFQISSSANLNGVLEIMHGNKKYFGIESEGKSFATNLPSGNNLNALCFGITADHNLMQDYSASDIAGKYFFLYFEQDVFEQEEFYGGYEIFSNGTYTWGFGPENPDHFNEQIHFSGGGQGTWSVDPAHPERIIFTEGNSIHVGAILPDKMMIIDNGEGDGFMLGINYPDQAITQAQIAGNYRFLDLTIEGYQGVGNYTIPATGGNVNYYFQYDSPEVGSGTGTSYNLQPLGAIKNGFICEEEHDGEMFYSAFIILPEEMMMFFSWSDNEGLFSYGFGSRID